LDLAKKISASTGGVGTFHLPEAQSDSNTGWGVCQQFEKDLATPVVELIVASEAYGVEPLGGGPAKASTPSAVIGATLVPILRVTLASERELPMLVSNEDLSYNNTHLEFKL